MATTVTSKGQVTIPKHVRDAMDIRPGTKVIFDVNGDGEVVLRKSMRAKPRRPDRFERAIGSAQIKLGCSTDEYMEWLRGYADDPA
jgi:AbrB family looped-hinge helix DNA binding protein